MKKLLICFLFLSLNTFGVNQYYVSTSGSDSNNGTAIGTPWRHISKAIASFTLAGDGAQINVAAGTYSDENLGCSAFGSAVCINRGGSSPTVRLVLKCASQWSVPSSSGCLLRDSNGSNLVTVTANNIDVGAVGLLGFDMTLNGALGYAIVLPCNIDNTPGNCSTGNSVHLLGNYIHDLSNTINPCEVNPSGHPAVAFNNHHGPYMSDGQFIGNRVTNIGNQSLSALNGGPGCQNYYGIYAETMQIKVQNNVFINIAGFAVHIFSDPCQTVISNNVMERTEFPNLIIAGGDCGNGVPSGSNTVNNNVFGQTPPGVPNVQIGIGGSPARCSSSNPNLISNNIFFGASQQVAFNTPDQACTTVSNSKSENPTTTFASYTGGNNDNFAIRAGSTAIQGGAATNKCPANGQNPCSPSVDILNVARNITTPTIGAYEYNLAGTPPSAPTGLGVAVQ